ncbi:Alpha/Beta hydrolase protein, partial [Baffinella frigidus]
MVDMRRPLLLFLALFSGTDAFQIPQPLSPVCSFLGKRGTTSWKPAGSAPLLRGLRAPVGMAKMMSGGKEVLPAVQRFVTPALGAEETREWTWRGYQIRYSKAGMRNAFTGKPPLLLIHGFGSSADTWRAQLPALADAGYQVFAIDLLGLGYSEKPPDEDYSIRLWADMALDFIDEVMGGQPAVLFGNSIGGITSLTAAATPVRKELVKAIVLMNTAAGMNTKFVAKDPASSPLLRVIATPLFALLDFLFTFEAFAEWLFGKTKTKENVTTTLKRIYVNPDRIDDAIVRATLEPADDPNALKVFVKILTGDSGQLPAEFIDQVQVPMLMVWGDEDEITPLGSGYGPYFTEQLRGERDNIELKVVNAGHVPHDDAPE